MWMSVVQSQEPEARSRQGTVQRQLGEEGKEGAGVVGCLMLILLLLMHACNFLVLNPVAITRPNSV